MLETQTQVFSCEKNTFFSEHIRWLLLLLIVTINSLFWQRSTGLMQMTIISRMMSRIAEYAKAGADSQMS